MPIQPISFQMLNREQTNPELAGMQTASNLFSDLLKDQLINLQSQKAQAELPYAGKMAEQNLIASQLANKWNPQLWKSLITSRGAQSALANKQSAWYDKEAQARTDLENAQAGLYGSQAQKNALLLKAFKDRLNQGNVSPDQQSTSQGESSGNIPNNSKLNNSYFGIETPVPSTDDLINKELFGVDSYTPRLQMAKQQQLGQFNNINKKVEAFNKEAQDATNFDRLLNQYNYLMDHAVEKGPIAGRLPALGSSSQLIDNTINQMGLGAIEQVRDAMGSAKFAVADLNVAMGMKPQRTWTKSTRDFYSKFYKAVNDRLRQRSMFYTMIANNPQLGLSSQDADTLWSLYQNKYPIANKKGNKVINSDPDLWRQFLSPQAIESVKRTGDFNPIDRKKISNKDIEDTMKATGMTRSQVLDEGRRRGLW